MSDKLLSGQVLQADNAGGKPIWSNNARCCLYFQGDSNLVFYAASRLPTGFPAPNPWPMWASDTSGFAGHIVTMQTDGNLVMTRVDHSVVWASGTPGHPGGWLQVQDDGSFALVDAQGAYWSPNTHGFNKADGVWYRGKTSGVTAVVNAVEKIPVVGDAVHIVGEAAAAPFNIASAIASGERLDHVALGALQDQLKIVKDVAPYAQTVVSLVPGLGTGVAMAIGAGAALAQGQSLTDAAKSAIRGALPGGAISAAAFDTAIKVASGENVAQAALESSRNLIPDGPARKAFDIGIAVATGQKIQTALANGLASIAPGQLQSIIAAGQKALSTTPVLASALKSITSGAAAQGFTVAAGLLSHTGLNEQSLTAVRNQLPADVRSGFDAALNTQIPHIAWLKNVTSAPVVPPPAPPAGSPPRAFDPPKRVAAAAPVPPPKAAPAAMAPRALNPPKRGVTPAPAGSAPAVKVASATPTTAPTTSAAAAIAAAPAKSFYGPYPQPGALSGAPAQWGPHVRNMPAVMVRAGLSAVNGSHGRPRKVRGPDGTTYLFAIEQGVLTARPQIGA